MSEALDRLEKQLTGPRKIGLFGHRAVGKTTLLAMFYREAASGRVPGLRMVALNASTAEYLAEKIAQIESGEPPGGTLAETELALRVYRGQDRLDLIVKDYQGEHTTLGSEEPIQQFFADCDAVFLCVDPDGTHNSIERRRRQQEIEHLLERYLEHGGKGTTERPVAMLVTKYDRVLSRFGSEAVETLIDEQYGMTRHALACHVPRSALFAVSSYGPSAIDGRPPGLDRLRPMGLEAPLDWLLDQIQALDLERLDWLLDLAPRDLSRHARCLEALGQRYPDSNALIPFQRRLDKARRVRRKKRALSIAVGSAIAITGLAGWDAWSYQQTLSAQARRSAVQNARSWTELLRWHPTLDLFWPTWSGKARVELAKSKVEVARLEVEHGAAAEGLPDQLKTMKVESPELASAIAKVEETSARKRHDQRWFELKAEVDVGVSAPEVQLTSLQSFLREFPETTHRDEAVVLVRSLKERVGERRSQTERRELEDLDRAESLPNPDLRDLIDRAEQFLARSPESSLRGEVQQRIERYARQLDERDIERARQYSKQFATHFQSRIEKFQDYLRAHQTGGRFVSEAMEAKDKILREWDAYSYRLAADHLRAHPSDVEEVAKRLRDYQRDHPEGRWSETARTYLTWFDQVTQPHDYRVTLRRAEVDPAVGKMLSGGGPDLAVTLEVAGVIYGPSPLMPDTHRPIWDYTFARPIKWKLGDPVVVRLTDYDWTDTDVAILRSPKGDPLGMSMLSGTIKPKRGGKTLLVFSSDFAIPVLPSVESEP